MLHVDEVLPPTSIFKENNKSKPCLDPDTTVTSWDVESDLDDLDLNVISKDDIEEETLPIHETGSECGEIEGNANTTSAEDEENEGTMDMRPLPEVH